MEQNFTSLVSHKLQVPKMADIWPIENVWAMIKQDLKGKEISMQHNRIEETDQSVLELNLPNQDLGNQLLATIPKRLEAVVNRKGNQITNNDH